MILDEKSIQIIITEKLRKRLSTLPMSVANSSSVTQLRHGCFEAPIEVNVQRMTAQTDPRSRSRRT